jgi:uroporphyrinogen-III synthase
LWHMIDTQHYHLLWFRPQSPLDYALPDAMALMPWQSKQHLPVDILQPLALSCFQKNALSCCDTWILSSPTAAHIAAPWGIADTLAVMGSASQAAWRQAGGKEPKHWIISPTGESMGLFDALKPRKKIAILRGNTGRNELIERLREQAVIVDVVAAYHKQDLTHSIAFTRSLSSSLIQPTPVALCFTSTDQPQRLLNVCDTELIERLKNCPTLVSHTRIQQAALSLNFKSVFC